MNKQSFITILLAMLISMPVFAYDFEQNGIYYEIGVNNTVSVVRGTKKYSGKIDIPSRVYYNSKTYNVTVIGFEAFEGCYQLTSISIPSSISSIEMYAFDDCTSLSSVHITDLDAWCRINFNKTYSNPLEWAHHLFMNGTEVKCLIIPSSVTSIKSRAFCGCSGLISVSIPQSVTSIDSYAFYNCTGLTTIVSEIENPATIEAYVFSTSVFTNATLFVPAGKESIYRSTAAWNTFTNITDDSSDLKKRTIHVATAGTLPNLISAGDKYLVEELILSGEINGTDIKFIRDLAGRGLGDTGDRWDDERYSHFTTSGILKKLDMTNASIVAGGEPYYGINRGSRYPDSYYTSNNSISGYMFYGCQLSSIKLPNSVTSIVGEHAFDGGLTSVTIPNRVTSIGQSAFYGCSDLTSIKVEDANEKYDSRDNCNAIIETSSNTLMVGCKNTIIPNSVTSIGQSAFSGCSGLTSVTIPNSVTSIGSSAFYGCSGLTSVTIPNDVTTIGNSAFYGCSGLTSVTIGNSVTSIGRYAFDGCSGLTSVHISDIEAWCGISFDIINSNPLTYAQHLYLNGEEIKDLVIPNSVTSIGQSAFSGCSGLTSVTIPNTVTSIGYDAFRNCSGLTSVTIPNSVTSIGSSAFYGSTSLTSVTIPNSVTSIGGGAFNGCSGLTSVTIPNSVTSIGSGAFRYCSGLTSVTIPNSVTSIGSFAFDGCSGLTSVTIPNSVTFIGEWAFSGCSSLTSVSIPNSMTSIDGYVFNNCSGLTSILCLNDTPPTCNYTSSFSNVTKENCVLWVPKGCVNVYREANVWKDFQIIREIIDGDVNLDGEVNHADLDASVDFIMGKAPEGFYENLADLNGDDVVDAADVVKLVTILNLQEGLNMDWQAKYSNQVISSLSCTLNNDGDKAIQLTKCELYFNESLVGSANFKVTLASGGSKNCSFDDLASYSTKTGFSVVWYYTYNGDDYTYRCEIEE